MRDGGDAGEGGRDEEEGRRRRRRACTLLRLGRPHVALPKRRRLLGFEVEHRRGRGRHSPKASCSRSAPSCSSQDSQARRQEWRRARGTAVESPWQVCLVSSFPRLCLSSAPTHLFDSSIRQPMAHFEGERRGEVHRSRCRAEGRGLRGRGENRRTRHGVGKSRSGEVVRAARVGELHCGGVGEGVRADTGEEGGVGGWVAGLAVRVEVVE